MSKKKTKKKTKRQPARKKQKPSKTNFLKNNLSLCILGLFFLLLVIGLSLVFIKNSKVESSPSLVHLVASASAQKGSIKIDQDFSYDEKQLKKTPPKKIIIPDLKIDIPIVEAEIVDGFWETATDSASFGLGSAYPGQTGNTVIFAHAREGLFASLSNIKKGDNIYVFTDSNWYPYQVEEVKTVLPHQVEVVSPTKDKRLTLYTCIGFGDTYRLVVIGKPLE